MKQNSILLCMLLLIAFSLSPIYAQDSAKVIKSINNDLIDSNYLMGVKSSNDGLRVSSAYYLGERKNNDAVIPLMNILHKDGMPEARIMAALSLFKIGDQRGIYAIKQAIEFDENEMVKKMCNIFYQMYLQNNPGKK